MDREKIIKIINQNLPLLQKRYQVKKIGLFGSVARKETVSGSDIDIMVDFLKPIGFFDFIKLENELTHLLGHRVDLVSRKALKPCIKNNILKDIVYV